MRRVALRICSHQPTRTMQLRLTTIEQARLGPTGTDWQKRDSTRHDWLFTLGQLPVIDG